MAGTFVLWRSLALQCDVRLLRVFWKSSCYRSVVGVTRSFLVFLVGN